MTHVTKTSLFVALFLVGCAVGLSKDEAQTKWDGFVNANNACTTVDDCALIQPECPLGCHAAVNVDAREDAVDYSADLASQVDIGGPDCEYKCGSAELACEENRCVFTTPPN